MHWRFLHPRGQELVGFIPQMISEFDPRPLREQLDSGYQHGGGWSPMKGWTLVKESNAIKYPGDPALLPVAAGRMRNESIFIYQHAWVMILQDNGDFEVARMD